MSAKRFPAIYIRVSTDAQYEEGYSVEAQKEQLAAYCISKGLKNYQFYIDGGWSGSSLDRPEIQRLISDAVNNRISHCIVYKLDRLSRSQKDTLYLIEDVFNPHGVDFVSLNESMDTSTPMGRLMLGILSAFAQLERENIRMRTRMGMRERIKDGYWMGGGRVPFGYDYDKEQGILIPNEDAEKVRQIYRLYIDGYSTNSIAHMLGLKYEKLALQILKRKSNYGIIEYNGEEYQGRHEPLISRETYDLAMSEMLRRSSDHVTTARYLLTGIVYCGKCGAKMRYQKWGKNGAKLVCYSQQKSKPYLVKDPDCAQEKVWAEEVEDLVVKALFALKEQKKEQSNDELRTSAIDLLNQQCTELEKKVKKLYNLYADSENDLLLETIRENERELERIREKLRQEIRCRNAAGSGAAIRKMVDTLEDKWDYMTLKERQTIIRSLVDRVIIIDRHIELKLTI